MWHIWKYYEIPILMVALINWLLLYVFSESLFYGGFGWCVVYFSVITLLFSSLLEHGRNSRPVNIFSYFTIGKALKFFFSILFLLLVIIRYPEAVVSNSITIGLLFLVTLIVDTTLFMRFARTLKKENV